MLANLCHARQWHRYLLVHSVVYDILELFFGLLLLVQNSPGYVLEDTQSVGLIIHVHCLSLDVNQKFLVGLIFVLEARFELIVSVHHLVDEP